MKSLLGLFLHCIIFQRKLAKKFMVVFFSWLNCYESHFQILWKIQILNHSKPKKKLLMKNSSKWGSFYSFILVTRRHRKIHSFRKYSVFIAHLSRGWDREINLQWTKSDRHSNPKSIPRDSTEKQVQVAALFLLVFTVLVDYLTNESTN